MIKRMILRILLGALGSGIGYILTLIMFVFRPNLMYMNPNLFILNIGFFTGYLSSFRLKGKTLALYFIYIFAAVSLLICIDFYGLTFLCFLNILGCWMTIAAFAIIAMIITPMIKRRLKEYYNL